MPKERDTFSDSSKLESAGLQQAIIKVAELPPSESAKILVSLLSLYYRRCQDEQEKRKKGWCQIHL
jgi:hypothetical protein